MDSISSFEVVNSSVSEIRPRGVIDAKDLAYPVSTSRKVAELISRYEDISDFIEVSFREMVNWLRGERATHYIHPYPAKLLPQIAHFFLADPTLFNPKGAILDPFCGSGTVALETVLSGRKAYWADVNPLARLITRVKTSHYDLSSVMDIHTAIRRRRVTGPEIVAPDVVNLTFWYTPSTIDALSRLKLAIEAEASAATRDWFMVALSATARLTSKADPRFPVPVKRKPGVVFKGKELVAEPDVYSIFDEQLFALLKRHQNFQSLVGPFPETYCVGNDARAIKNIGGEAFSDAAIPNDSVDGIITSPPYASAQKYIRSSSLSLGWLSLASTDELRLLNGRSIGRERFSKAHSDVLLATGIPAADRVINLVYETNRNRAAIASHYLLEMRDFLAEAARVLKPGAHMVIVVGNNQICGQAFETSEYLCSMAMLFNLDLKLKLVDTIKGRGLLTKRHATAGVITHEWILLFRKRCLG